MVLLEPRRLGRPPFPPATKQSDVITIRVTDAVRRTLRRAAAERGISVSHWARAVLLTAAADAQKETKSIEP
jgi:predicted HicB family RNase H-like nuclease